MNRLLQGLGMAAILAASASFAPADVVVLKGGTMVPLKQPWVRRGNTAYITRADGTLLSVPVSEIDRDATAVANQAAPAPAPAAAPPASTPAEAVRSVKEVPKAKVRITDADVSHPLELPTAPEDKKAPAAVGGPRVEVVDYTQEKNGGTLVVKGSLRNPGQGTADNVSMTVTAVDEKGQSIDATTASLSKGAVESGSSVEFVASLPNVGDKNVSSLRFSPQWAVPKPPPPPPPAAPRPGTAEAAAAARAAVPAPRPTPFGQGTLYAAPAASAPSQAPADGKSGDIPGASSPDNQPKPPSR